MTASCGRPGRLLQRGIADLTILGDEGAVRARAAELGVRSGGGDGARIRRPASCATNSPSSTRELRGHKGMTVERAREIIPDISYFGTMMVYNGIADGMVSGAAHTTAHTMRPAFEIIKTEPGVSTVSSVFLMCLADRVLVYGDCAVVPDPTAEQLADIAISSARTAAQFGIEPRVAMLSYSTGESGSAAPTSTRSGQQPNWYVKRQPELLVDGPIQYDAAVEPSVAATQGAGLAGRRARDGADLPGPQYRQQHVQGGAAQRGRDRDRPGAAGAATSRSTICRAARSSTTS